MLGNTFIPNLIQGVSQQPQHMRLASQCDAQVNAYGSPIDGLSQRPPTQYVARLDAAPSGAASFHFIDRDTDERYVVAILGSTVKAWLMSTGASVPVYSGTWGGSIPSTWATYASGATSDSFRMMSVADYTFIINRDKVVTNLTGPSNLTTSRNPEALVTVLQGAYKSTYTLFVKVGSNAEFSVEVKTWDGSEAVSPELQTIKTDLIAQSFKDTWPASTGVTVTRYGSTIHIQSDNTTDFTIRATDSGGDTLLIASKDTVARLSDLPVKGPNGFKIAVNPDPEVRGTAYWVAFTKPAAGAEGAWVETVAPGVTYAWNKATTPFVLKRLVDGTNGIFLSLEEGPWTQRAVGDTTTAPWPSFVGQKIQDVFFFRNRLGFISSDKVCMSESGNYFNFIRSTVAQLIDSDPIDVGTLHTSVSTLRAAIPTGERVILFSDAAQFSLGTKDGAPLTPSTVTVVQTTEFASCCKSCRPAPTGRSVMFMQKGARYATLREFFQTSTISEQYDAIDVSSNASFYIDGTPKVLEVSTYDNLAVVLTSVSQAPSGSSASVWNYKWTLNGNEKIQSAWSSWEFPACTGVLGACWLERKLYLLMVRTTGLHLEYMDFEPKAVDSLDFIPALDCLVKASSMTWDGTTYTTVPTGTLNPTNLSIVCVSNGQPKTVSNKTSNSFKVPGNVTAKNVYFGLSFTTTYRFSTVFLRNQQNLPLIAGRTRLTYGRLSYSNTGAFTVTVAPCDDGDHTVDRPTYSYIFDAAGSADVQNLPTGDFTFPVHGRNTDVTITISSASHLPFHLNSATFEVDFASRSPT